ncbi:MAG: transcription antitermination factor NusB [bacterium]
MSRAGRSEDGRRATPARRAAFETLRRTFEHDAWTDRAFRSAADRHGLEGAERARSQRLAYGAVQRRGTTDHLAARLAGRPVAQLDPPLRAGLRLGLFELLFSDGAAAHAAVGEAVELAKGGMRAGGAGGRAAAAAGLVNAVLRQASRDPASLLAGLDDSTPEGAAVAHSYPGWLAARWWEELGPDGARALMAAMNEPAERALRVNTLRADPAALAATLRTAGERVEPVAAGSDPLLSLPETLVAGGRWGEALRARIAAGEMVPQSRASQAVAGLLDPQPGERVLDLCAGPGIKSTAIAARMGDVGEVRSIELDPRRASQIAALAERAGAGCVRPVEADAAVADLGAGYDRVLVDPPCTDLGALAARPDARWRKTADQADQLAVLQREILVNGAASVRPGGRLVYSTCTISRAENEAVVAGALAARPELEAEDLGRGHPTLASAHDHRFLQTRPDRDRTDGFFMALIRRREG